MLLVFGSINIDLVARVRRIARPGETVLTERYETAFGGKGANQAVAAARVIREDIRVLMVSAVGNDAFGQDARANLAANGVDVDLVRSDGRPTGCAFITVDDNGENAITVASGANLSVCASDLGDEILAQASIVVLQMETPLAENVSLAARAQALGVKVVVNLAPIPAASPAALSMLLRSTDLLIVNEHEAEAAYRLLTDTTPATQAGHQDVAAYLAGGHDLICVVTLGADGILALRPSGMALRIAAPDVDVVDTTGAGDTFVGILAAGLAEERDLEEALARACRGASLACQSLGAQAAMPARAALDAAMNASEIR